MAVFERPASARAQRRGLARHASDPVASGRRAGHGIAEMQRARLLAGAVGAVGEHGYSEASVARITERARVSRRTFYEFFENREECLLAALDRAVERIAAEIATASLERCSWRERLRGGLWVILCFFDREPALARLCIVESQRGEQIVLERRQELVTWLAGIVDEGYGEDSRSGYAGALTGQGVVGAVLQVLQSRLLEADTAPLADLLGQLMGLIVLPYLGIAIARREQARPAPAKAPSDVMDGQREVTFTSEPLAGLPMRLTYRTARVLEALCAHPASSNRQVADLADIHDQGQVSKLLARLERVGLLANTGEGHTKGEPNAWRLTALGERVTRHLSLDSEIQRGAA
jgi:AcrR family transcriptional regulator